MSDVKQRVVEVVVDVVCSMIEWKDEIGGIVNGGGAVELSCWPGRSEGEWEGEEGGVCVEGGGTGRSLMTMVRIVCASDRLPLKGGNFS